MRTRTRIALIGGIVVVILIVLIARNRATMNEASHGDGIVTAISVSVVPAEMKPVSRQIAVVGTIAASNDVVVLSEAQGRVLKLDFEVGQYKSAGSVLVEVDSELKGATFKAAQVTYEKAKKDLDRYEALYAEHSISDSQIEQARWTYESAEAQYIVARRQLNDTKITTPISGIVTARYVNVGTMVMSAPQATQIANIVDISRVKAKVSVAEKDVLSLRVGDPAEAASDLYPHTSFPGTVYTISSKGDEGHTYAVEVLLNNPRQQLKAGMFVDVTFSPKSAGSALIIPRQAILGSLQDAKLYVVKEGTAKLRAVTTDGQFGTDVEITDGVKEGELVVVDGQDNLSDNIPVVIRK
ncbi:MAG TPA: efflux RND transporter periplasmic adaptor subunit [Bacteroidota bacterium]|nr:efflux RND transporter periplasmic adaptor subunit [Bacteroidota bacterium]